MKVKQLLGLTALALAAGGALADETPAAPLTRAEVVQSVLAARAAGTLIPAGQGELPGYPQAGATTSSLTRAQVKADVMQARANGELVPAGGDTPEDLTYQRQVAAAPTLTRGQVKAEVLQARAEGTLIPAGQGEYSGAETTTQMAHNADPASPTVALHSAH